MPNPKQFLRADMAEVLWPAMLGVAVAVSMLAACGAADRLTDCAQVCDRYAECADESYDVQACTERCDDVADDSEAQDTRLDRCEDCLDDRSCAESVFPCAAACVGIVP